MAWHGPTDLARGGSLAVVNAALLAALPANGVRPAREGEAPDLHVLHYWCGPEVAWARPGGDAPYVVIAPWEQGPPPEPWLAVAADPRFKRLITPSEWSRERFLEGGWPPWAVTVIPNGVDTTLFTPDGPRLEDKTPGVWRALFVGGLIPRKGVDLLYEAWRAAFEGDEQVRLVLKAQGHKNVAPGGGLEPSFYAHGWLPPPADLPNVRVLGDDGQVLAPDNLAELYRSVDCVVQPYRYEGFCLPLLEAMASGTQVVSPNQGPALEYVPGGAGQRFRWGEAPSLADALQVTRLRSRIYRDRPAVLGRWGREAALGYSWEKIAAEYAALFREVCGT